MLAFSSTESSASFSAQLIFETAGVLALCIFPIVFCWFADFSDSFSAIEVTMFPPSPPPQALAAAAQAPLRDDVLVFLPIDPCSIAASVLAKLARAGVEAGRAANRHARQLAMLHQQHAMARQCEHNLRAEIERLQALLQDVQPTGHNGSGMVLHGQQSELDDVDISLGLDSSVCSSPTNTAEVLHLVFPYKTKKPRHRSGKRQNKAKKHAAVEAYEEAWLGGSV